MREIFGVAVTDNQIAVGGLLLFVVAVTALIFLILIAISKKVREVRKVRLLSSVPQDDLNISLKRLIPYFLFHGRTNRKQFIIGQIVGAAIIGFCLGFGWSLMSYFDGFLWFAGLLLIAGSVGFGCWFLWALNTRRFRDTGVTVWWVLALLVPPLNLAAYVFLLLVPTDEFAGRGL